MAIDETILKTVKKMFASGLSEEAVRSALADLGLSKAEQDELVAAAKGKKVKEKVKALPPEEKPKPEEALPGVLEEEEREEIAKKAAEKVRAHLEEREAAAALRETGAEVALEEARGKLAEIHEEVRKVPTTLEGRLDLLEKDVKELKAYSKALQDLLKKILETNRSILLKIKK